MITVNVYTMPNCPACSLTKRHLDRSGIPYTEIPIDSDEGIGSAAIELGFTTAPVVMVNVDGKEYGWDGYRPDRIDEIARSAA